MAYRFVEKEKHTQEEMAFIVYMIVSSYFHKATCRNPIMAKRLYLYYREMSEKLQESKERQVIREAEKIFKEDADLLHMMNCEVVIRKSGETYLLDFLTGFEQVHTEIDRKGKFTLVLQSNEIAA